MPILENADPLEPRLDPDLGLTKSDATGDDSPTMTDAELLTFLGEAKRRGRTFQQVAAMGDWEGSQAAYRSEHAGNSKYLKDQYKNRAKYFKPKTRAAVRKNLTATANAMFATRDVMSCDAEDDSDPVQQANAALIKGIIDARFNSKSRKSGVPWFQTALGARFDAQVQGACVSKQTWRYLCVNKDKMVQTERPVIINGVPAIGQDGQPMVEVVEEKQTVKDVIEDRPVIDLIPSEMVLIEPTANWIDPIQDTPNLIVIWPMHIDDVKKMMSDEKNPTPWRSVTDAQLEASFYSETEIMGLKAAREGTSAATTTSNQGHLKGTGGQVVEVWECFTRRDGVDNHCWSLKSTALLSDLTPTDEVYPAQRGIRPYVMGTDILEPHVLYPQSHVRSWKPSQDEINDFSNLRMDATRQSVFPTAKVVAGRNIDYKAVQRRDGQGIILVREPNDVTWDRPPGPTPNAFEEVNLLSNDFDEIAGIFSQNSVQSNKQIGDTVGGMQMISSNANATSEFDLRCFIDTWVERVLSQIVFLEQYYEDDANLIAIAGKKAQLFEKFGVSQVTDELLESQITIGMNVGIGSSDPMQKLAKFKTSFELAMPILQMALQSGKAKINYEEVFDEIFSNAGYRNGADRFITVDDNGTPAIPPEALQALQQKLQQLTEENQQLQQAVQSKQASIAQDGQAQAAQIASDHALRDKEIALNAATSIKESIIDLLAKTEAARITAGAANDSAALDTKAETLTGLFSSAVDAMTAQTQAPPMGGA